MKKTIEDIAREDGRYDIKALKFVFDGLGQTIQHIHDLHDGNPDEPHHITGDELANGLARIAIERWGRLARVVLNYWGLYTTRDLGEIVYLMIGNGWMTAQESDKIEDFDNVFDFETIFEKNFDFDLSSRL